MTLDERGPLLALFRETRARTESLAARLSPEDQQLQSLPEASPAKWHRAHTTWFFETFLLGPAGVPVVDSRYGALFNSYYEAVGPRHERAQARPLVAAERGSRWTNTVASSMLAWRSGWRKPTRSNSIACAPSSTWVLRTRSSTRS